MLRVWQLVKSPDVGIGVRVFESIEGSETQAHGNGFHMEVGRLDASQMSFGGMQHTAGVDDESGPDTCRPRPVCPKLNICWSILLAVLLYCGW